jgi:hypothetical protein
MQLTSFRNRLAAAENALAETAPKNDVEHDPWHAPTSRIKGRVGWDGVEHITSREVLDALEVPVHAKRAALYRRLNKVMQSHGWQPVRVRLNSSTGCNISERVRGYERQSGKLPVQVAQDHPGRYQTDTPYILRAVVGRLEADSRWALSRSVRALVAERDQLKAQLEGHS